MITALCMCMCVCACVCVRVCVCVWSLSDGLTNNASYKWFKM